MKQILLSLIKVYQYFSKFTPKVCRFYPTCSEYTKQAIEKYGILKGGWLGLKRICRCHPGNPGGYGGQCTDDVGCCDVLFACDPRRRGRSRRPVSGIQ